MSNLRQVAITWTFSESTSDVTGKLPKDMLKVSAGTSDSFCAEGTTEEISPSGSVPTVPLDELLSFESVALWLSDPLALPSASSEFPFPEFPEFPEVPEPEVAPVAPVAAATHEVAETDAVS